MPDEINTNEPKALPPPEPRPGRSTRALGIGGAVAILIAGAALGAGGTRLARNWAPQQVMLLQPASISDLREDTPAAIKGQVADVFGNKFVVQDSSGRALVDTGPGGEDRNVVTKGETITAQGRFDRGILHAEIVAHADGRNDAFGPPGPKGGPMGPRADRDGPPPPPPPGRADRALPPPPPAPDRADRAAPPPPAPQRADRGPPPPPAAADRNAPADDAPPPPPR